MDNEGNIHFNWPILGHQNITSFLERLIEKEDFVHTYLFTGPRDIGKKTVAHYFIESIFCQSKTEIPCGLCNDCKEIEKNIHPDFTLVNLQEDKKNISIDQIREFQDKMRLSPMRSKYKVGLICQADLLNIEASNALLKTIEEPPRNSIIILLAEKIENILPTIISRAQNIIFNNVSNREIYEYLKKLGAESDLAKELADFSGGAPGIAINYFKNLENWKKQKDELSQMIDILDNPTNEKLFFIDKCVKNAQNFDSPYLYFENFLNNYLKLTRDLIVYQINKDINLIHPFLSDSIEKISSKYNTEQLLIFYKEVSKARKLIFQNINPKIILENLIISL